MLWACAQATDGVAKQLFCLFSVSLPTHGFHSRQYCQFPKFGIQIRRQFKLLFLNPFCRNSLPLSYRPSLQSAMSTSRKRSKIGLEEGRGNSPQSSASIASAVISQLNQSRALLQADTCLLPCKGEVMQKFQEAMQLLEGFTHDDGPLEKMAPHVCFLVLCHAMYLYLQLIFSISGFISRCQAVSIGGGAN